MRITGRGRALGALLALIAVSGCRVEAVDAHGTRTPVRATPGSTATPDDAKPGAGGSVPGSASREPGPTASRTPPPKVLWSRGDRGRDVREVQARLRQLAWLFEGPTGTYDSATVTAVWGFQGKRGLARTGALDAVTWQRLLSMTHEPARWELYAFGGQPAAPPDPRCLTGRVLCVSKTSRTLRWMVDGRTVSVMDVRFGSQYTPTREGVFSVDFKSRYHVSTIYHTSMPYAMFFSGGQAVHYSADFAARGYAGASHGCVNVRDEGKIAALFAQVRTGDKVVVYW
ncbi:L,D-transpeptidase family protein [Streptomyces sp. NPDC088358]|uniref:L,D-transpeptidase family protein n=1 Tax=Streptomyces sp. NPDC088358 TaxID=3365857 RepID=UPI00383081FC